MSQFIDRRAAKTDISDFADLSSALLQRLVDYSADAQERCWRSRSADPDVYGAPIALFRHVIQSTDAIEVLISNSCVDATIPLLRSSFEATLGLRYICTDDAERRALAWLCADIHADMRWLDSLITPRVSDELLAVLPSDALADAQDEKDRIRATLDTPIMSEVLEEYKNRGGATKDVRWYSLFGGPAHLGQLAGRLEWADYYETLYKAWCRNTHGNQSVYTTLKRTDAGHAIRSIRSMNDRHHVVLRAAEFMQAALESFMRRYRGGEEDVRKQWYSSEIDPIRERIEHDWIADERG